MSEKRLTGRRVYEPTGEVRKPVDGDWWLGDNEPFSVAYGVWSTPRRILRLVEDFREIERPSKDAVELARNIKCAAKHDEVMQCVRSILSAEAAFAEPDSPPAVLDRIVDEVAADVLREEMERGGEPLIRVGQGDYAEETDDPFDEVGRSSMCGGLEIVGWAILLAAAWAVACFW